MVIRIASTRDWFRKPPGYTIRKLAAAHRREVCHFVDWCEHVIGSQPVSVGAESDRDAGCTTLLGGSVVSTIRYADGRSRRYSTSGWFNAPR